MMTSRRQQPSSSSNKATNPVVQLPIPARARLSRELSLLHTDPPPGIAAYLPNPADMSTIRAQITGPESSPFASGLFLLSIHITSRYPFEPPRCRFLTSIYHPNIDCAGRICLDTLKSPPAGSWSPAVSLPSLLLSIRSLMSEPNPDDGLVPDISQLYKCNPKGWFDEAKKRTEREATAEIAAEMERKLDGTKEEEEKKKDTKVAEEKKGEATRGEKRTQDASENISLGEQNTHPQDRSESDNHDTDKEFNNKKMKPSVL